MRTRHWLAGLLSGALWATTATVGSAQPPAYGAPPMAPPGAMPYVDPAAAQGQYYAPPMGMEQPGWPPGAVSWPQISPFEAPPVDQHRYENGFWFNEQTRGRRRYYAMLTGTINKFGGPNNTTVGDPKAPGFFVPPTTGGQTGTNAALQVQIFEPRTWGDVEGPQSSGGFLGQAGWFNADDSGWFYGGFFADEGRADLRIEQPWYDLGPVDAINQLEEDVLRTYAGIPLFDGVPNPNIDQLLPPDLPNTNGITRVGGSTQPYDTYYRLFYQSQTYGTGVGWYSQPWMQSNSFKLRPLLGMRYLNVRENAVFEGGDSGLTYTFNTGTNEPTPNSVVGTPLDEDEFFQSYLRSNTKAHLGGPEIGARMDFGSEKFLIWTQSRFGLLANHSTRELEGFGIGRAGAIPVGIAGNIPIDSGLTSFHSQETTTSVSPIFEQSIFLRAAVLSYVPVVKKLKAFEQAQFTIGYTALFIGQIYRPGDVIEWNGFPSFPQITSQKSTFYVGSTSIGVEWEF